MTPSTQPAPGHAVNGLHPVATKLRRQVLPYVESAKMLERQWFYRLHQVFGYTTDVTVALGAIGIGLPLLTALTKPEGADVTKILGGNPAWLYYSSLGFVVVWVILRVAFNREDGQKKAVLARSCRLTLRQAEASLYGLLDDADPMPALNKLIQEQIKPTVDRNIQEGSWPWSGPSPEVDRAVDERLASLRERYEAGWRLVDPTGLRT